MFTYILTALGAAIVLCWQPQDQSQMDAIMALAVGLMLSAVISLVDESLELAEEIGYRHNFVWVPLVGGTAVGCLTMCAFNYFIQPMESTDEQGSGIELTELSTTTSSRPQVEVDKTLFRVPQDAAPEVSSNENLGSTNLTNIVDDGEKEMVDIDITDGLLSPHDEKTNNQEKIMMRRRKSEEYGEVHEDDVTDDRAIAKAWLLVIALAIQHIPEALAVGVACVGATKGQSIALTLAIGLQDIPEGMAASLVLIKLGMPGRKAFYWGQMTGIGEPIAGVLGALAVSLVQALLPYALGFAGGTMLFIIVKDMIPECMQNEENQVRNTLLVMLGFSVMLVSEQLFDNVGAGEDGDN